MALIELKNLSRFYNLGGETVKALNNVSLSIDAGEFVAVMGPSGSGKSTFMNISGCLDQPTEGSYRLDGIPVAELSSDALANLRNRKIGFVFQEFNLLQRLDALGNVELPMIYAGMPRAQRRAHAAKALVRVGLAQRMKHRPTELSGGQQQRVAIARALVNDPKVLLADEPTGALDSRTSLELMSLLQELNREGTTIVVVTHEPDVARFAARLIRFRDGRVIGDTKQTPADAKRELADMPLEAAA